ncbi:MAG: hypothetical protein OEQ53_21810, partial [Saprospiraceae bacterium]|nr:hypothetical protein [Saprospiraceae bacterium]
MGRTLGLLAFAAVLCISFRTPFEWGFFGHRLINRMAVFTLPPELIKIYKPHIEFVAAHAVDPDKRRYSTVHEAVRHYIDLDHWGHYPFDNLPRNWDKALIKFCDLTCVFANGDTVVLRGMDLDSTWSENQFYQPQYMQQFDRHTYQSFFRKHILPGYFEDPWEVPVDSFEIYFTLPTSPALRDISVQDTLSRTGILPYHLTSMQQQLTRAFVEKDLSKILRLSTDLGHYIGDAHVPL